ncbi:MAG: LysR family transcriptional regulator [Deltaproteobacteria bacterium]|nr:LysR family transcriptional regulator [Deltaproteobacteria bacterium]
MLSTPPILDHEQLAAFALFCDERNFTRAAQQLHLSQPALFERIRRLSETLGVTLYRREGRTLHITAEGQRVAVFAREELRRTSHFLAQLRGESVVQSLVLAAGEGAYLYLLPEVITQFATLQLGTIAPLVLGGPAAVEAVQEGRAHVAVAVIDTVPRELAATELVRVQIVAAMKRTHPLARRKSLTLAQLSSERLVLAPPGRAHRAHVARHFAALGVETDQAIEADGWPLMLAFASAGLGVALVNGTCVLPQDLVAVPVPELGTVTYRAVTRRANKVEPPVIALVKLLGEVLARPRAKGVVRTAR